MECLPPKVAIQQILQKVTLIVTCRVSHASVQHASAQTQYRKWGMAPSFPGRRVYSYYGNISGIGTLRPVSTDASPSYLTG